MSSFVIDDNMYLWLDAANTNKKTITYSHGWDFRDCKEDEYVMDNIGDTLKATLINSPICTSEGITLDGINQYIDLDAWEWGGTTSFEMYVKWDDLSKWSRLFEFADGSNTFNNNISLCRYNQSNELRLVALDTNGTFGEIWTTNNFISLDEWIHIVLVKTDTGVKIYKNGVEVAMSSWNGTSNPEFSNVTRTWGLLGKSHWSGNGEEYFKGSIAYFNIWHGMGLVESDISTLYENKENTLYKNIN